MISHGRRAPQPPVATRTDTNTTDHTVATISEVLFHLAYAFVVAATASAGYRRTPVLLAVSYPLLLLFLPDPGQDFPFYERAFDSVNFDISARNWYSGGGGLTAEPPWFWYSSLLKSLGVWEFRVFLVVNFWICLALIVKALRLLELTRDHLNLTLALLVPVVFPTIFFRSPRSSISLALCLLGLAYFANGRSRIAVILVVAGSAVHSQFLVVCLFSLLVSFKPSSQVPKVFARGGMALLLTLGALLFAQAAISRVGFIPNFDFFQAKLSQFEDPRTGFRLTGLLSIFVVPFLAWRSRSYWASPQVAALVLNLSIFSLGVNLAFLNAGHIAGRLSRLSDFLLLPLLGSWFLIERTGRFERVIPLAPVFVLIPFAYPTLYLT